MPTLQRPMLREKDNKTGLFVFRLPESLDERIVTQFKAKKIVDIRSKHQFARKIVTDYLQGRLIYVDSVSPTRNGLLRGRGAA